jgi:hypothetical protein
VGGHPKSDALKESSLVAIVVTAWLALLTVRGVILGTGIDHCTTIDLWSNPMCALMGVACGVVFAVLLARNYFAPPTGTPIPERTAKLKQNNFLGCCYTVSLSKDVLEFRKAAAAGLIPSTRRWADSK